MSTATYTHETETETLEVEIDFSVCAGEPMTRDYPGSPPELDIEAYRVKVRYLFDGDGNITENFNGTPEDAARFEAMCDNDSALFKLVAQACWDAAEAEYEYDDGP